MKAPPSLIEALDAIQAATEANMAAELAVRRAIEDLVAVEVVNAELVITHCVKALRHLQHAEGLRGDRRTEVRSARRMGLAALGREEVA